MEIGYGVGGLDDINYRPVAPTLYSAPQPRKEQM